MEHAEFVKHVRDQVAAMREAAVAAGPDAKVPSCPGWTVFDLVRHIANVHSRTAEVLVAQDITMRPEFPHAPKQWDDLLEWWDKRVATLVDRFVELDQDKPTWMFTAAPGSVRVWARRQAHETAIHRIDAELAQGVESRLIFDPQFAADGIDERLTVLPLGDFSEVTAEGTILFHAADAGRAWTMTLRPGQTPEVTPALDAAIHTDAVVAGTADAVYRAVWNRPSTAVITGAHELVEALPCP
ncbi:maleylpyruvate isomerase family mycothiol-dependent enzyme [Allokutzneria sp. A3M-2-11 16]|uniref:maleylpyruvate isomerase family mycothiol-dependent enzyme n=1 Tax=Allokutzneria sp. A3M-2-11 16 TaxID=2962043 RepID=UPI0020B7A30B|nr:maleylpyruvate isomerase family mycothiol-dependent enzyme [Allokutzneria sp. A3M-2-11 16]MCP3799039.1 maleylpyruvate isomerase family mycothiol-dependent enzyme [Allokutzneria sp. A3M-2-11 16]